ncbi:unnamed protein product [Auanema sp. JU1783]|nr:unnamed protein product [Auanema sp. JU1783]
MILSLYLLHQRNELFDELLDLRRSLWETSIVSPLDNGNTRYSRRILSPTEELIFIGGMPRSGTTLMRVMLDSHQEIRCGDETMLIPLLLNAHSSATRDLHNSTLKPKAVNDAVSAFISELIAKNGPTANRLCNKDPFQLLHIPYLMELFPNARFIFMIRDPRAVLHSMISRDVPVAGFNFSDPIDMLKQWEKHFKKMYLQCRNTPGTCLTVYYERLVQASEEEARRILKFLRVEWSDAVLHHEELMGSEVLVNPQEFSASQVKEKINQKALTSWFDFFSDDFLDNINRISPLVSSLGYDTLSSKPDYSKFGSPDFYTFHI